jgi:hypothetical protein
MSGTQSGCQSTELIFCFSFQILDSNDDLAHFGSFFFTVEIKGCKHFTKTQSSHCADGIRQCFSAFETHFSCLDWEYMHRPENGTLLVDLGITHHPVHSIPIVGLWHLDSLEASFGAAGFTVGTIHHLNTLSLFGGLQAEMSLQHMHFSHVVFRSAYNLAYEVTHPVDNNRELFKDKDAYLLDSDYVGYIDQVTQIYTNDAVHKSFGVRNEIRLGGEAFLRIVNDLDFQAISFTSSCNLFLIFSTRSKRPCFPTPFFGSHHILGSIFCPREFRPFIRFNKDFTPSSRLTMAS